MDKNKINNYYKNLEWVTGSNNMIHAIGRKVDMIDLKTNKIIKKFNSISQVKKYLNIKTHLSSITQVCKGKGKTAYGYKWKYSDDNISVIEVI